MGKQSQDQFDKKETARRLESILRGAFSGSPKPMKDIPRKRAKIKRKPRKPKASAS